MNKKQKDRFEAYVNNFSVRGNLLAESIIKTLACLEVEEEELQASINRVGLTYETPSGQRKQNPEWQQLKEDRARKSVLVGKLHELINADMQTADPLAALHAELD